jgi:pyridoxamine 5'-phosphate oxidase
VEQVTYFCLKKGMELNLNNKRNNYTKSELHEDQIPLHPFILFRNWYKQAEESSVYDANAMVLSTVSMDKPSSRVVLLKELNQEGFVFYTNYLSRKGNEIKNNSAVALNFFWRELEKQVRIEGLAVPLSSTASDTYFDSRPLESRMSAIISPQSQIIPSRQILTEKLDEFISRSSPVKRPDFWGGFVVVPESIEFWQGRADRLHDRIVYTNNSGIWKIHRLAP